MIRPSKHVSKLALYGLRKSGDILVPGIEGSLSFSKLGCIEHVDRLLDYMPENDVKDFGMVLMLFGLCPKFILRGIFWVLSRSQSVPGWLGGNLARLLWMGVRGVIYSLTYSGYLGRGVDPKCKLGGVLDYQVHVAPLED